MNTMMQSKNLTGEVSSQEKATVTQQSNLKATVASQGALSGNLKPEGALKARMSKASYKVDSELSEESENPVQNKVVTAALSRKAETLKIAKNTDIDKLFK